MRRRLFLKGAGVVTVVAVGGGVWRAYDQGVFSVGTGPAYEPWKDWRNTADDGPLELVRAAILAASPHNTQPWLFKITPSSIELYLDPQRNVGALDPYLREEHIGMGCALENLMLAAPANGYTATAALLPGKLGPIPAEPKPKLVARVDLVPGQREAGDLYNAIPRRHTNRSPYDPHKPIPPDFVAALSHLTGDNADVKLFLFTDEADRKKIVELSSAANANIYSDPDVRRGSERWVRTKWSSLQKFRDGLSIDAFGQTPIVATAAKMMPQQMFQWVASHRGEECLCGPDAQRTADRVHRRARPIRSGAMFAGRPHLAARASVCNHRQPRRAPLQRERGNSGPREGAGQAGLPCRSA